MNTWDRFRMWGFIAVALGSLPFSTFAELRFFNEPGDWGNALNRCVHLTADFAENKMVLANEISAPPSSLQNLGQRVTFPGSAIGWPSDLRIQNNAGSHLLYMGFPQFRNAIGTAGGFNHDFSVYFENGVGYEAVGLHFHVGGPAATTAIRFYSVDGTLLGAYTGFGDLDRFAGVISDVPIGRVQYDDASSAGGRGIAKVDVANPVEADAVFFEDDVAWANQLADNLNVETYVFSPDNMTKATEIDLAPVDQQNLGDELRFDASETGLPVSFSIERVTGNHLLYQRKGGGNDLISVASSSGHHDWQIRFDSGEPVYDVAFTIFSSAPGAVENIQAFDTLGNLIAEYSDFGALDPYLAVSSTRPIGSILYNDSTALGGRGVTSISFTVPQPEAVRFFLNRGEWAAHLMRSSVYSMNYAPDNFALATEIASAPSQSTDYGSVLHFDGDNTGWPVDYRYVKEVGQSILYQVYTNELENIISVRSGPTHEWSIRFDEGEDIYAAGLGFRSGAPADTTAIRVFDTNGVEFAAYTGFAELAPFIGIIADRPIGKVYYDDAPTPGGRGLRSLCIAVAGRPTIEHIGFFRSRLVMTVSGLSPNAAVQIEAKRENRDDWEVIYQFVPDDNVNTVEFRFRGVARRYDFRARLVP